MYIENIVPVVSVVALRRGKNFKIDISSKGVKKIKFSMHSITQYIQICLINLLHGLTTIFGLLSSHNCFDWSLFTIVLTGLSS